MLQFIIDGYNLVHKIAKIKESASPCHQLLSFVYKNKLTGSTRNEVWVVFDGRKPPYDILDFQYKVVFSNEGSADDLIIEKVKKAKNKKQVLIVTDDRELGYKVKLLGARVCRVDKFISKKEKPQRKESEKEINYSDRRQITEEMRRVWLDGEE